MKSKDLSELKYEHHGKPILNWDEFVTTSKELKPCPFCGEAAEMLVVDHIPDSLDFIVRCTKTGCCGRLSKRWSNMAIAAAKWNDRPVRQEKETAEPEFTREQLDQIDNVENAAHQLVCALCKDWDAPWNIEYIGEVADAAEAILKGKGLTTSYPAMVDGEDGIKIVE